MIHFFPFDIVDADTFFVTQFFEFAAIGDEDLMRSEIYGNRGKAAEVSVDGA